MIKISGAGCFRAWFFLAGLLLPTGTVHAVTAPPRIIVAGYFHALALKTDGSILAWGNNRLGQLGNDTQNDQRSPIPITTLGNNIIALAAGHSFSIALKADGSVWGWGSNRYGQLGDNTRTAKAIPQPVPVPVPGTVTAIAAGRDFAFALKKDGSLWAWGFNGKGQLGDDTRDLKVSPVQVLQPGSGVVALTAGDRHVLALKADGSVRAWGDHSFGQLGDGDMNGDLTPARMTAPGIAVVGLAPGSGVIALAAGTVHSLALKKDGSVWAWGHDMHGQLGNGSTDLKIPTPLQVFSSGSSVIAIAAGGFHSLALKTDGSVWAWGRNNAGQLGDGTTESKHSPVQVLPPGSGAVALTAAGDHSIVLKADGSIWEWGETTLRELGHEATASAKLIPTRIPDFSLSAGKP